jgi:CRISPR system Cascade subunit CasA
MSGFFGQGNYGTPRMNGGFGSRPRVRIEYGIRMGQSFRDDIARLLPARSKLLSGAWRYRQDGVLLTWIVPWNLKDSLTTAELDPFFIETSRAVRILPGGSAGLCAVGAASNAQRISAKDMNGLMGDPWIPVNLRKTAALTVGKRGFTPELLADLIFERDFTLQAMQLPVPEKESQCCSFHASVLARGQGTTDGFHDVVVSIPASIGTSPFRAGPERELLAKRSKTALNDSSEMQDRVLKPALFSLLETGPEQINFDKRDVGEWVKRAVESYSVLWAAEFFPWLWRSVDMSEPDAFRQWRQDLSTMARGILNEAVLRFPMRDGRRLRARVRAEDLFDGCLYKTFPGLMELRHERK